jgi:hypothetical protein
VFQILIRISIHCNCFVCEFIKSHIKHNFDIMTDNYFLQIIFLDIHRRNNFLYTLFKIFSFQKYFCIFLISHKSSKKLMIHFLLKLCLLENSKFLTVLRAFSLENNCKNLISMKRNEELSCICGLRVWVLIWVICCHTIDWTDWTIYSKY